jgi:small subunit ribosomal protein S17
MSGACALGKESEGMSGQKKTFVGRVVSDKMDKTVVVRVDRLHRHRLYKKVVRATRKYKAHDEENACSIGDIVRIAESRPLSRDKRWVVQEILEKAG